AVALEDGRQPALDLGEGLVPCRLDEAAVTLDQRRAQPVRVFVQVFQRHALGAEEAAAEDIVFRTADRRDAALAVHARRGADLQPAAGLAQGADAVVAGLLGIHRRLLGGFARVIAAARGSVRHAGDARSVGGRRTDVGDGVGNWHEA